MAAIRPGPDMDDNQLLRYSRHILLPEIGIEGQEKLLGARALLIGAGGLGAPASLYLAASGVGRLTLCDHDSVDLTNLQRQIVHFTDSIGRLKVDSARATLARINPEIAIETVGERVAGERLERLVEAADVVIDATDNFATRHAINRACVRHRRPLVSGAAIRFDGQVAVFDLRQPASPCYHCLFPESGDLEEMRCAVMGVFAPLVGVIGATQAAEALKLLMGVGRDLTGRLLMLDALSMEWRSVRLKKDPACPVCGGGDTAQKQAAAACAREGRVTSDE
jgi:adenylyltransferase/sulfurtransferase